MEKKEVDIKGSKLELVKGDITSQDTDAVVNAANRRLAPGGGVAGAIHRAAGPELYDECKKLGGCETWEAKITKGYDLPAEYVIHTVGPIYSANDMDEKHLRMSYRNCLKMALEKELKSISFPALSTGAFGYPVEEAAEIALEELITFLEDNDEIELIRMVLYSEEDYKIHVEKLDEISSY